MDDPEEVKDLERRRNNVKKFCLLINDVLSKSDGCEVFLCWEGDHAESPIKKEIVNQEFFKKGDWVEDQPTVYTVRN